MPPGDFIWTSGKLSASATWHLMSCAKTNHREAWRFASCANSLHLCSQQFWIMTGFIGKAQHSNSWMARKEWTSAINIHEWMMTTSARRWSITVHDNHPHDNNKKFWQWDCSVSGDPDSQKVHACCSNDDDIHRCRNEECVMMQHPFAFAVLFCFC